MYIQLKNKLIDTILILIISNKFMWKVIFCDLNRSARHISITRTIRIQNEYLGERVMFFEKNYKQLNIEKI